MAGKDDQYVGAVVFDVDGTLADCSHRLHHIQKRPKDWDAFFAAMDKDAVIEPMRRLFGSIASEGRQHIVICSGRPETYREQTEAWLRKNGFGWDKLFMRPAGDRRDDQIVKKELLDRMRAEGWAPFLVVDDRKRVVDMWRENGLTCLQCAPGEF